MPLIARVKIRWNGLTGGPGYSVFHFRDFVGPEPTIPDAQGAVDKCDAFIGHIVGQLMPNVNLQTMSDVDVIDEATGTLETTLTAVPDPAQAGMAGSASMSGTSGGVITWRTGLVRNSRRIRGRTFVVPLAAGAYEANGSLTAGCITALNAGATALRASAGNGDLGVWARPSAPGAADGLWGAVTGHSVPDMAAVLRSRRA